VDHPRPAWVRDITCVPTREGWLCLAAVIDLRTRQVLGYSLSERMPGDLVRQAFLNARSASPVGPGVLFHSDRGSQYASGDFGKTLAAHGFEPSMSRRGNCWDNAVAESFFATLKSEEATGVYASKAAAHAAIASYIHGFYNPTRLHSALGYRSPNDYAKTLSRPLELALLGVRSRKAGSPVSRRRLRARRQPRDPRPPICSEQPSPMSPGPGRRQK
jgi:transposase InsO family protein